MSRKSNLVQNKSLGQHWLVDQDVLKQISKSLNLIDPKTYDLILEIGPGRGALTQYLLKVVKSEGKHLVAVEFDDRMYAHLQKQYPSAQNLKLIHQDYLKFNEEDLLHSLDGSTSATLSYIIIANLPYNISSPIFAKLVNIKLKPIAASLLIQKEVAQRLVAEAGQKGCSPLSIKLNNIYETELGLVVPKSAFDPPPKVTSQIIKLKLRSQPIIPEQQMDSLMKLVNIGFKFRRKKLINNLSSTFDLSKLKSTFEECNIDLNSRAENLSLTQWVGAAFSLGLN